jgi:hypothetical protein
MDTALWLYIRCNRCGEAIQVRADRRYDVASEWLEPGDTGPAYTMHKDIVGDRCFQRISIDVEFNTRLEIVAQRVVGGTFLTPEAYAAAVADAPADTPFHAEG